MIFRLCQLLKTICVKILRQKYAKECEFKKEKYPADKPLRIFRSLQHSIALSCFLFFLFCDIAVKHFSYSVQNWESWGNILLLFFFLPDLKEKRNC